MLQENVELVRRAVKAFNDRDIDPTYRGRAGLRKYQEDADAAWETLEARVDEIRDLGIACSLSAKSVDAAGAAAWMSAFRWRGW